MNICDVAIRQGAGTDPGAGRDHGLRSHRCGI